MKKIFFLFTFLIANSVFTSCTDLEESLENETIKTEIVATGGEDGQVPIEEEDPANGG